MEINLAILLSSFDLGKTSYAHCCSSIFLAALHDVLMDFGLQRNFARVRPRVTEHGA